MEMTKKTRSSMVVLSAEFILCFVKISICDSLSQRVIPEKIQTGRVEDMEFPGVLKKEHVEIPGVKYKRSGISRDNQEQIMWDIQGFCFWCLNFQGV